MKKIAIVLAVFLSVVAIAAQKPCGEVFPNAGLKVSLDGSRCVVSKFKGGAGEMTTQIMVSHDNSLITIKTNASFMEDGEKKNLYYYTKCEDVGGGIIFECDVESNIPDGDVKKGKEKNNALSLKKAFDDARVSAIDRSYLFGGFAPWETSE